MHTRFRSAEQTHVLKDNEPSLRIPPSAPGSDFRGFMGAAFQREISVPRQTLLKNAQILHQYLIEQIDVLPFKYSYKFRVILGGNEMVIKSPGRASVSIGGYRHMPDAGNGYCELSKRIPATGTDGPTSEKIDIRSHSRIPTDDCGDITITRKKVQYDLPHRMAACIEFLDSETDEMIRVYSDDGPLTLRKLLRAFEEGSGGDDFAVECIMQGGAATRVELHQALNTGRFRKHHSTIIQLLCLCYPGDETRNVIEEFLELQPQKIQQELRVLFAAYLQAWSKLG